MKNKDLKCKIEECNEEAICKGFCESHYFKDRYKNDPKFREYAKERGKEYARRCREEDPELAKERVKRRHTEIRLEVVEAYGRECEYCGENHSEYLEIDHINSSPERNSLGKRASGFPLYYHLKRSGYPKNNFRLLCSNCNSCRYRHGDEIARKLGEEVRNNRRD